MEGKKIDNEVIFFSVYFPFIFTSPILIVFYLFVCNLSVSISVCL